MTTPESVDPPLEPATGDPPAKRQKPDKELKTLALQYPNPTVNVVIALPHHYTAFYFFYST